ncbi:Gfo/Idh/MocA family protein [Terriglobus saanensis]|uniref:Oxidoreductase domain protein n=1 Tax=Terriglobus saanensis (strain ATCC BAA-1853 / DSM 23119 / SP1PR4) TaxID=401053 RepID=E8UY46_TERSS|nr:Gfo/Idh/MocA family oxidoreductase [Terriglobus saanensis]ADV80856.1 oxidoreductase domain protein [Terriglobus saanensis SP1PR4]
MKKIGVGIIGASPLHPGWAVAAHIPALRALPQYELRAVSTSRRDSAEAAREAFQVSAYDNHRDLIHDPNVDLVVVSVKVTDHLELVSDALAVGKMVFSEWPLGVNLSEALDLESKAVKAGVRTLIGLQGRFAPEIQHARNLIAQGYIGDVLSASLVCSGISWGGTTPRSSAYLFNEATGATPLTVPLLHTLDTLAEILGEFKTVSVTSALRRKTVKVVDDSSDLAVTTPDQVSFNGLLESGGLVSVFFRGGSTRGDNLYFQINGSEGDLVFQSAIGNIQVASLRLQGGAGAETDLADLIVPDDLKSKFPGIPTGFGSNVARLYAQFAADIEDGTKIAPDFGYAVRRHRLIVQMQESALRGCVIECK